MFIINSQYLHILTLYVNKKEFSPKYLMFRGKVLYLHHKTINNNLKNKDPMATKRKANAAFMKPLTPSAILAEVVGSKPLPRTEVVKKMWAYIKKNKLQDEKNRRNINADDKLKAIFGGKKMVNMFEMTKLVSKHLS